MMYGTNSGRLAADENSRSQGRGASSATVEDGDEEGYGYRGGDGCISG
jgi:hypothetical protein